MQKKLRNFAKVVYFSYGWYIIEVDRGYKTLTKNLQEMVDMRNNDKVVRKLPQDMNPEELRTLRKVVSEMNNINPAHIKVCKHAKERLGERNISREAVNEIYKYCTLDNVVETNVKDHQGKPLLRLLVLSNKVYGQGEEAYRVGISVNSQTLEVITVVKSYVNHTYNRNLKSSSYSVNNYIK